MAEVKTLQTQIAAFAAAVGGDIKSILASRGNLANLTTAEKSSLVLAINELKTAIGQVQTNLDNSSEILDTATDTTHTWSASKIGTAISDACTQAKNDLLNGAGTAYDTLKELGDLIDTNKSAIEALEGIAAGHVKFDAEQTLTDAQKGVARGNIDAASVASVTAVADRATALEKTVDGYGEGEEHVAGLSERMTAVEGKATTNATNMGELSSLTTEAKVSLVAAINEVDNHADAAQSALDTFKEAVGDTTVDIKALYEAARDAE